MSKNKHKNASLNSQDVKENNLSIPPNNQVDDSSKKEEKDYDDYGADYYEEPLYGCGGY